MTRADDGSAPRSTGRPDGHRSVRPRGRPRSHTVDDAVRAAVVESLIADGYEALSIERVAARSGVAKATIYRRWRSKAEMVFALAVHGAGIVPPADHGSLDGDVHALSQRVVELMAGGVARAAVPGLLADLQRDRDLAARVHDELISRERAVVAEVVRRSLRRGETAHPPDPNDVHAALLGTALVWIVLLSPGPEVPSPAQCADISKRIAGGVLAVIAHAQRPDDLVRPAGAIPPTSTGERHA